ncbi:MULTISPECIES: efflux RND transporter periplasmic adaptor subunit [Pseudomonas]|uniref:efflux RND transporter periplasmic adaptor subunit n=1 Tax=Pseudomonas TaxID=286 RepID=UPI00123BD0C6|nr:MULTISPECIES: efflux RND transporter periplasmic adaptor subunit [Pseudomonas]QIB52725.1 efflux RND transporter periplasmic adaptor subunit [Pseudomonas sp. OIL-1]
MPPPTGSCFSCLFWLTLSVPLLGAVSGCAGEEEPAPEPPRIALVERLQAAEPLPEALRFPGVVESVTTTQIAFQVPGRIEQILVDEGARVTRGQPLAKLDATDYELQLREAEAQHRQLQADLTRKRSLLAEGILSPAAIEPLEAELISAQVARDSALRNIAHSTLNAPFDGVVAERMAEPDMVVSNGTPILQIQDNQYVEVGVDLPERAALSLPLGPDLQAQGQLVIADVSLPLKYKEHSTQPREGARTYRLTLRGAPPEDFNLLPGMAMRVAIELPAPIADVTSSGFRIPLSALQTTPENEHFVWLAVDGQTVRKDLTLQRIDGSHALVAGDFEAGSQIIVAGGSKLFEGQTIKAQQRD